uniref:Cytoplasmic dynein 2 heavy chain 1 n=1 Tax=Eptatretus burgeri TaxID=7764 RepID=A0A8C4QBH8_EPTBU
MAVELAVRFGKTLLVLEVENLNPLLIPLLRRDLRAQGPHYTVQLGDKFVDYHEDFRLFLATRNPSPKLSPTEASLVTAVNFTTTRSGLCNQLLALALLHECPEIEKRRTDLLQQEETNKVKLASLEESLLQKLATARGNILEDQELIESLNQTKSSSKSVEQALTEAAHLKATLQQERDTYLPLADSSSTLFFLISDLPKLNPVYRFNLAAFLHLFQRALRITCVQEKTENRISVLKSTLLNLVYEHVARALFKEWDFFCGLLFSDTPHRLDSPRSLGQEMPTWLDAERAGHLAQLLATFPRLKSRLQVTEPALWCTSTGQSANTGILPPTVSHTLTHFQQVLVLQAIQPDHLLGAMMEFACCALGLKELFPAQLSLRRIFETETTTHEPVLLLSSPGADPSHELREMAAQVVGLHNYQEVAMGQGQAECAVQALRDAAMHGSWLCLKNLHLVLAWLPNLEKELNDLSPNDGFRLWLTAEPHPNLPPNLLQASLKLSYEAPPGLKQNLLRSYEHWEETGALGQDSGLLARAHAIFALAWFHGVCQERCNYIPQGWTKFYEFSQSDLRAGFDIIHNHCKDTKKDQSWDFVRGLLEEAVYGGRVDRPFDLRLLAAHLRHCFNGNILGVPGAVFVPDMHLPATARSQDYRKLIEAMPDSNRPAYIGLPSNVEHSAHRSLSSKVTSQLKLLSHSPEVFAGFERNKWTHELSPFLNLWKKLNHNSELIHATPLTSTNAEQLFVGQSLMYEERTGLQLVQIIHSSLRDLSRVIRGTSLPNAAVHSTATSLLSQQCPAAWQTLWEGPADPAHFLRTVVYRARAVLDMVKRLDKGTLLSDTINLSDLFHPQVFLNALRQQTARNIHNSMDTLRVVVSWKGSIPTAGLQVKVNGLLLEGGQFASGELTESPQDSPLVCPVPPCHLAWLPQALPGPYASESCISLPVYASIKRDRVLMCVDLPCRGDPELWLLMGVAICINTQ